MSESADSFLCATPGLNASIRKGRVGGGRIQKMALWRGQQGTTVQHSECYEGGTSI